MQVGRCVFVDDLLDLCFESESENGNRNDDDGGEKNDGRVNGIVSESRNGDGAG